MPTIVATELPCVGCGYNLQMQPVEAVCTECGRPVRPSLEATILRWGGTRLRRMAVALRRATVLMIITPLILPIGVVLDEFVLGRRNGHEYSAVVGVCTYGMMALFSLLYVPAIFVVTGAPPGERRVLSRWLCRMGSATIWLPFFILACVLLLAHISHGGEEALDFLRWTIPLLMLGWVVHVERAASLCRWVMRRGGMESRSGLAVWSLRILSGAFLVLTASVVAMFIIDELWHRNRILWDNRELVRQAIMMAMGGSALVGAIALILVLGSGFRVAGFLDTLATMATTAEQGSFTQEAPPDPPTAPAAA